MKEADLQTGEVTRWEPVSSQWLLDELGKCDESGDCFDVTAVWWRLIRRFVGCASGCMSADRRRATLSWNPVVGATGCLVRYVVAADKLHLSCVTRMTMAKIRSLDAAEDYIWSICAFNEASFGLIIKE